MVHPLQKKHRKGVSISDIELEDQVGNTLTFGTFFSCKPSIVVFFYTRCDNPNKCSLTVTKLARLQKAIGEEQLEGLLRTAAITYDPEYDLPRRLKAYGENRGVTFSDDNRMFRARSGFRELQEYFQLGVNFTGSTVNRHRIELFVFDSRGEITATFTRLQWDVQDVLEQAKALLSPVQSVGRR
jgi:protein SCO1/2